MRYEFAILSIAPNDARVVLPAVDGWCRAAEDGASPLGCWISEAGEHADVTLLRAFPDDAAMARERWRVLATPDPFGCGALILSMRFESYVPFPWVRPVAPGRYGQIYEIRTYWLKHGGIPATMAAWEAAMPARERFSPLLLAMYALDGPPRFTHIWPYRSVAERTKIRADTVAKGIWPPKGAPDWLTGEMRTTIAVPTPISRLL